LTFAEAIERISVGDGGRSRLPTDDRDEFAADGLHPKAASATWRRHAAPPRAAARPLFLMFAKESSDRPNALPLGPI